MVQWIHSVGDRSEDDVKDEPVDYSQNILILTHRLHVHCRCSVSQSEITQEVLISYYSHCTQNKLYSAKSLWSVNSGIKALAHVELNTDMDKWVLIHKFLNHQSIGIESKKAPVSTLEEVVRFMKEAGLA